MVRILFFLFFSFCCLFSSSAWAFSPIVFEDIKAIAQDLAGKPYVSYPTIPEFFLKLNYNEWMSIRYRPEKALWAEEKLPFNVQFFHPGLYYDRTVKIHIIDQEKVEDVHFDPALFKYPTENMSRKAAEQSENLNFAGFRLHFPINNKEVKDEAVVFLGASYFRALAKGSSYGIYSRGLAIDTALPQGEEFPYFTEFWIEKPSETASKITIYALMDSPSLAGAYRFVFTPGSPSLMLTSCSLYSRQTEKNIEKIGLAPLTSMFFYGEEKNGRPNDFRPEVHNSDGLQFTLGDNNWIWKPLTNPKRLNVHTFSLNHPKGFGLFQRDSDFSSYEDIERRFYACPSLWVEPIGDWGRGSLNLVEIPTEDEIHDNIVAFWCPDKPKKEKEESSNSSRYPSMQQYQWKLFWLPAGVSMHDKGYVTSTRTSREGDVLSFYLDFAGKELENFTPETGLASIVETPEAIPLLKKQLLYNEVKKSWRLEFKVRLPKEEGVLQNLMSARKGPVNLRFSAYLKKGENLPEHLTETWNYDWQLNQK